MKVRIRDIAAKAGVSPATVSNALNGKLGVNNETAAQIQQLAEKMGYVGTKSPSKVVKANHIRLVMLKKHGLVVMDTQFFMELIESIERECHRHQLNLMISRIHIGQDPDYMERIRGIAREQCVGVIALSTEIDEQDLALFKNCESPFLVLDNSFLNQPVDSLVMDNFQAGFDSVSCLYNAGHRQIGHITSNVDFSNMQERRNGFEAAMHRYGLDYDESSFWPVTPTLEGAHSDMLTLLGDGRIPPTAFFAGNDIIAIGCMRALQENGYTMPGDVSIVGMDDIPMCQFSSPKLTTIRVYRQDLGSVAVRMLLDLKSSRTEGCVMKTKLSVSLIERDSVAAPSA